MRTAWRTDMTKLIVVFRNFEKTCKRGFENYAAHWKRPTHFSVDFFSTLYHALVSIVSTLRLGYRFCKHNIFWAHHWQTRLCILQVSTRLSCHRDYRHIRSTVVLLHLGSCTGVTVLNDLGSHSRSDVMFLENFLRLIGEVWGECVWFSTAVRSECMTVAV
jgi:ABC-type spermidine/putrescine transport system permease subunit I